jgi:hypothetical protein
MDYPGEHAQDMLLPGKYDRAGVRFTYGGVVDVWAKQGLSVKAKGASQSQAYKLTAFTNSPGLFGVYYFPPVSSSDPYEFIHYSRTREEFGLIGQCSADGAAPLGTRCQAGARWTWSTTATWKTSRRTPTTPRSPGRSSPARSTPRAACAAGTSSRATSTPTPATCRRSPATRAPTPTSRCASSSRVSRTATSWTRSAATGSTSTRSTSPRRVQYRYLDKIQQISKAFAFGAVLDGDPAKPSTELIADGNMGPLALAATHGLDLFARIVTRPEPGHYCPGTICGSGQPVGVEGEIFAADSAALPDVFTYDFRVALGDGRYLHNDFDYSQGYFWGDYQTQVGTYYEKIWATYYLAEAFDSFVSNSKEDFYDSRYKNVSFATIFPEQVRRLYSSLVDRGPGHLRALGDGEERSERHPARHADLSELARRRRPGHPPAGALLADPNYGFNPQLYAMVWGSIYFPTNWSSSWVHDARIAFPGEDYNWAEVETFRFYDPRTGLLYSAHKAGTESILGRTVQAGTGARILEWANHLLATAYLVDRDINGDPILGPDGRPTLLLDVDGLPQLDPSTPGADAELARFVDTVDLFHQLIHTFEQPLGELPEP